MMAYMYFAKVNINDEIYEVYKNTNKLQNILDNLMYSFNTGEIVDLPKSKGSIKFITVEKELDQRYIYGRLIKVYKDELQYYDDANDDLTDLPTDKLVRSATFYFDLKTEIVAFTTTQFFGPKQFCLFFEMLINKCVGEERFKVFLLKDADNFKEKLKQFKKITEVNVTIVPKNPGRENFNSMFANPEAVQSTGAKIYKQTFKADGKDENGLNMDNYYMNNTINGVMDGYGDMKVIGIGMSSQKISVTSDKDAPERIAIPNAEKKSIPSVVEKGMEGIKRIISKFHGRW